MAPNVRFYTTALSSTPLDETGGSDTSGWIAEPGEPEREQIITSYIQNIGADTLTGAGVRARLTTWVPTPPPSDVTAWRQNATLHILPRLQFSLDGITYSAMGAPLPIGTLPAGGPRVRLYTKYTSVTTDARTGLPYDYSPGANPNDYPYAYALEVYGGEGVAFVFGTIIGL